MDMTVIYDMITLQDRLMSPLETVCHNNLQI